MPLVLAGAAVLVALGYAVDKTGEGINDASSGFLKLAIVAGVGYYIFKESKVIK